MDCTRFNRLFLWASWASFLLFLGTGLFYQSTLLGVGPSWGYLLFAAFLMSRHIGWLAPILWLIASLPIKRTIFVSIVGLVLASSFMVFDQTYETFKSEQWVEILGFGWGYMFWLWAFIFQIGDKLLVCAETANGKIRVVVGVIVGCAIAAIPSIQTKLERDQYLASREEVFQSYCDQSGARVPERVQSPPSGGIFQDPRVMSIWAIERDLQSDQISRSYIGALPAYLWGWEETIERFADISVKESLSVNEDQLDFRRLSVIRRSDNATLAEFAYVIDTWANKFCSDDLLEFSELDFYRRVFPFAEIE